MSKAPSSLTVLNPINFPHDIEIQIHTLDPITQQPTGGFYPYKQHRSWDWIRKAYTPPDPSYFDECEAFLREGLKANLSLSEHSVTWQAKTDA